MRDSAAVMPWGRPVTEPGAGWAVIDVETSGFKRGSARVISLAVLALDADGHVEQSVVSLLNPGVDPGPTHIHGLTAEMLEDQPQFSEMVGDVVDLVRGRTLVAHNVAFDYGFLTSEADLAGVDPPALAERQSHPRRASAVEGAGVSDALPVPESGPLRSRRAVDAGHAGRAGRRSRADPRRAGRTDSARRTGLRRRGGPGNVAGDLR